MNHKDNNCPHKNKICDYCKREGHLQKVCFKKQHNDKINDITINEEDNSDHAFMNIFIISEKFHKNQLTRHNSGRICSLQELHYTFIIIIDSGIICHAFYNRIMFESIKLIIQNASAINESLLNVQRQGNVHLHYKVNRRINKIIFQNTFYTSDLKYHVILFKRINKSDFMIIFQKSILQLWKNDRT